MIHTGVRRQMYHQIYLMHSFQITWLVHLKLIILVLLLDLYKKAGQQKNFDSALLKSDLSVWIIHYFDPHPKSVTNPSNQQSRGWKNPLYFVE